MKEKNEKQNDLLGFKTSKESFKYYFFTWKGIKKVVLGLITLIIFCWAFSWLFELMPEKGLTRFDIFIKIIKSVFWFLVGILMSVLEGIGAFFDKITSSPTNILLLIILILIFFVRRRLEKLEEIIYEVRDEIGLNEGRAEFYDDFSEESEE